jgi:hypothetical protein
VYVDFAPTVFFRYYAPENNRKHPGNNGYKMIIATYNEFSNVCLLRPGGFWSVSWCLGVGFAPRNTPKSPYLLIAFGWYP